MKRLVQINVTAGRGSTGVIAEEIGREAIAAGWESTIVYGQSRSAESASKLIRVGSDMDVRLHGLETRLFDNHGLASRLSTKLFLSRLSDINPDIVHLHNIHGYYINYPDLFRWLRAWGGPVVWTLHDCWPFTGHCAYFGVEECSKWRTGCGQCPHLHTYPMSLFRDRSVANWRRKREIFTALPNLTLIAVSNWLGELLDDSFLAEIPHEVIHNGIDISVFNPKTTSFGNYIIGVANVWENRKGLSDFLRLRDLLPSTIGIKLVGLTLDQIDALPDGIIGITRTSSREELAALYAGASVFVNPTYEDNFPTVNIEALACGTPVVTYRTGGSPEAVDAKTGVVVERGDVKGLADAIAQAEKLKREDCRARAVAEFNAADRYRDYVNLYHELLKNK